MPSTNTLKLVSKLRVVVASPQDVEAEREAVVEIISRFNKIDASKYGYEIESFLWETDSYPEFHEKGAQGHIDNLMRIEESDIFIGIFRNTLGSDLPNSKETGTEHEFKKALQNRQNHLTPKIMLYFGSNTPMKEQKELDAYQRLLTFRNSIKDKHLYDEFNDLKDFENKLEVHLKRAISNWENFEKEKQETRETDFKNIYKESFDVITVTDLNKEDNTEIDTEGKLYSCFNPKKGTKPQYIEAPTTNGYKQVVEGGKVKYEKHSNDIYIVRDPIRPFEIQIGKTRASRPGGDPGFLSLHDGLTEETIKRMYPFIIDKENDWLRTVFAELSTTPDVVQYINENDPVKKISTIAGKNPSAPNKIKEKNCLFCDAEFIQARHPYSDNEIYIIPNDYPFGPYFHYMVIPADPIHSWADLKEKHFTNMNITLSNFFNAPRKGEERLNGSSGIRIGLNSSIRHIVLGKSTKSSAGASIPHVHKQVWGMCKGSYNLGTHLSSICWYHQNKGIDYLGKYLEALEKQQMVLWEDDNFVLYIPYGQISIHEIQAMCKSSKAQNFLQLDCYQLESLSKCEYYAAKFYNKIGINSYNELMLSKPFIPKHQDDNFRLTFTFITREIDLAVSELNNLYVVDKFPKDTKILWDQVSDSIIGA